MTLKIKLLNLFTIVSLIGMMISLCACEEDYVVIKAQICCSSDLLDFVTPVVTIQGDNGKPETFKLNKEDFKKVEHLYSVNLNINGVSSVIVPGIPSSIVEIVTRDAFVATSEKKFKDVRAIKGNITIKYERNSYGDTSKDEYVFFNALEYTSDISAAEVISVKPYGTILHIDKVEVVDKDAVEKYITALCATERTISFDVK